MHAIFLNLIMPIKVGLVFWRHSVSAMLLSMSEWLRHQVFFRVKILLVFLLRSIWSFFLVLAAYFLEFFWIPVHISITLVLMNIGEPSWIPLYNFFCFLFQNKESRLQKLNYTRRYFAYRKGLLKLDINQVPAIVVDHWSFVFYCIELLHKVHTAVKQWS